MRIAGRDIGRGQPPYIVAEMGANHAGSLDLAQGIIRAASVAGADAVKIQVYDPAKLAAARGGADKVLASGLWAGRSLGDLYHAAHTPREWLPALFKTAEVEGITLFASVFEPEDVDALEAFDCPAYKIASAEIARTDLIRHAAATGKPLIISTGMGDGHDVSAALAAAYGTDVALLHCVSEYPCPMRRANLRRILDMRYVYGPKVEIGYSDHTAVPAAAVAAVALGASIIEVHVEGSWSRMGLDAAFALTPDALADLVVQCHGVWSAMQRQTEPSSYLSLKQRASA